MEGQRKFRGREGRDAQAKVTAYISHRAWGTCDLTIHSFFSLEFSRSLTPTSTPLKFPNILFMVGVWIFSGTTHYC